VPRSGDERRAILVGERERGGGLPEGVQLWALPVATLQRPDPFGGQTRALRRFLLREAGGHAIAPQDGADELAVVAL
jgi:hypothetical protein